MISRIVNVGMRYLSFHSKRFILKEYFYLKESSRVFMEVNFWRLPAIRASPSVPNLFPLIFFLQKLITTNNNTITGWNIFPIVALIINWFLTTNLIQGLAKRNLNGLCDLNTQWSVLRSQVLPNYNFQKTTTKLKTNKIVYSA